VRVGLLNDETALFIYILAIRADEFGVGLDAARLGQLLLHIILSLCLHLKQIDVKILGRPENGAICLLFLVQELLESILDFLLGIVDDLLVLVGNKLTH
jgi:hypothetical protein